MRRQDRRTNRRIASRVGAAIVEAAVLLPLLLLIFFGAIDLGIAIQRAGLCHEAARIGARMAVVHGADAAEKGPWNGQMAVSAIHDRIDPIMRAAAIDPSHVDVEVTWQATAPRRPINASGNLVSVKVTINSTHVVSFLRLTPSSFSSESRMVIAN